MKEIVYHVSEEEKVPLILNLILSTKEKFVLFAKTKDHVSQFFHYCKKYRIPYSHLYTKNHSLAFKNFNQGLSRIFFVTDENIENMPFFIYSCEEILHYDIPSHPLHYSKRNHVIKNSLSVKTVRVYCNEKETQDLRAIEIYFDKKFEVGKINQEYLQIPKVSYKRTKKAIPYKERKPSVASYQKTKVESQQIEEKPKSWWEKFIAKIRSFFKK